jgi:hypothetical protein
MTKHPYVFEPDHPDRVFELAAIGASRQHIAAEIGLSVRELNNLYREQLKKGAAHGHEPVLRKVHELAVQGENSTLLAFYLKSQCGWRDTGTPQALAKVINQVFSVGVPGARPDQAPIDDTPSS